MTGIARNPFEKGKPPATSLRAQQIRFDNFRYVFNNERPHEGLNNQVPASLFHPSSVRLPRKLPEFTYPKGLLLRRVNNSGDISWHKNRVFISEVFRFEELAFELITPGIYRAFYRDMEIGELNAEDPSYRKPNGTHRQTQTTRRAALKRRSSTLSSPISMSRKKTL